MTIKFISTLVVVTFMSLSQAATTGFTQRVSVGSGGIQSNGLSLGIGQTYLSFDGRYTVFASEGTNLVVNDTNGLQDIFVHDRLTGTTQRVSLGPTSAQATQTCSDLFSGSSYPTISADGRYVAYASSATNLVTNDNNCKTDVFVYDRTLKKTTRVSVNTTGGDANDWSNAPSISADGRFVAFWSQASNIVPGDTNGFQDIFVRDLRTNKTIRASLSSSQGQSNNHSAAPNLSADGRYVVFASLASNLTTQTDNNFAGDIFLRDTKTNTTILVSTAQSGTTSGNSFSFNTTFWETYRPTIAANGRYVAFTSAASDLVTGDTNAKLDVFFRDTTLKVTTRINVDPMDKQALGGDSFRPSLSADGRFVTFSSFATNLDPFNNNTFDQVYLRDRVAKKTLLISQSSAGDLGNQTNFSSSVSADGRYVAFDSFANNLIPFDSNNAVDVMFRDWQIDSRLEADVRITQSADANPVTVGQNIAFTVTVTNTGPDPANPTLVDVPPTLGPLVSVRPSQGTCSGIAIIVCRLGLVNSGASVNTTITVKATLIGSYNNQASVNAPPVDLKRSNNSGIFTVLVNPL